MFRALCGEADRYLEFDLFSASLSPSWFRLWSYLYSYLSIRLWFFDQHLLSELSNWHRHQLDSFAWMYCQVLRRNPLFGPGYRYCKPCSAKPMLR